MKLKVTPMGFLYCPVYWFLVHFINWRFSNHILVFLQHPDYEMTRTDFPLWSILTLQNDIAILRLETPVDLSNKNITKLNKLSDVETDEEIISSSARCQVTGWGYNYFEGECHTQFIVGKLIFPVSVSLA